MWLPVRVLRRCVSLCADTDVPSMSKTIAITIGRVLVWGVLRVSHMLWHMLFSRPGFLPGFRKVLFAWMAVSASTAFAQECPSHPGGGMELDQVLYFDQPALPTNAGIVFRSSTPVRALQVLHLDSGEELAADVGGREGLEGVWFYEIKPHRALEPTTRYQVRGFRMGGLSQGDTTQPLAEFVTAEGPARGLLAMAPRLGELRLSLLRGNVDPEVAAVPPGDGPRGAADSEAVCAPSQAALCLGGNAEALAFDVTYRDVDGVALGSEIVSAAELHRLSLAEDFCMEVRARNALGDVSRAETICSADAKLFDSGDSTMVVAGALKCAGGEFVVEPSAPPFMLGAQHDHVARPVDVSASGCRAGGPATPTGVLVVLGCIVFLRRSRWSHRHTSLLRS